MPLTHLPLFIHGDSAWPDLTAKRDTGLLVNVMDEDGALELAALPQGTVGGRTTVTIRVNLPGGRVVLAQTTLRLLKAAVRAFEAAHGEAI
jgi:hypothetical protein